MAQFFTGLSRKQSVSFNLLRIADGTTPIYFHVEYGNPAYNKCTELHFKNSFIAL